MRIPIIDVDVSLCTKKWWRYIIPRNNDIGIRWTLMVFQFRVTLKQTLKAINLLQKQIDKLKEAPPHNTLEGMTETLDNLGWEFEELKKKTEKLEREIELNSQ